jgi:predicted dehydrogenase
MAKETVIVVGAGGISGAWFPALKTEKITIEAVVDLDRKAAEAKIAEHELAAEASSDLDAMLKKHQPDFVLDLTVPDAHCTVTCKALRAGCHVLGEKPMASSMAEARKMVRTADQAGKVYMVSQTRRWLVPHEAIRRAVQKGRIGQVTTINCDYYMGPHFGGFRTEMPSPLILDMAIHHFDLARMFTGCDPQAVYCHEFNPPGSWTKGDIAATAVFEMSDGVVFTYRGSWGAEGFQTSWNGRWELIGTKGGIRQELDQPPEGTRPVGKDFIREQKPFTIALPAMKYTQWHGALREMLACLRRGKMPQSECHDNIQSLAMVFGAMESSRKRRRVPITISL